MIFDPLLGERSQREQRLQRRHAAPGDHHGERTAVRLRSRREPPRQFVAEFAHDSDADDTGDAKGGPDARSITSREIPSARSIRVPVTSSSATVIASSDKQVVRPGGELDRFAWRRMGP